MPGTGSHSADTDGWRSVLILAKITSSAAGGYAEYLEGRAQASALGDYYLKDGERVEAPGRWAQGAEEFGLGSEQPVTGEQLRTLMDVRRPDTGDELRRAGGTGEAVCALDATFSAPKSVSAAWVLAAPELRERIEQAHKTAIDRALTYAIRQVPMLRRRVSQDTAVHEKATGLIATSWRHTTARAVDEQAPIPSCIPKSCCTPRCAATGGSSRSTPARASCINARSARRTAPSSRASWPASVSRSGAGPAAVIDSSSLKPSPSPCSTAGQAATTRSKPRSASASPTNNASSKRPSRREDPRAPKPPLSCCARPGSSPPARNA